MNVCFVNTTDLIGGAERCSFDLHRGLRARGHKTSLVVGRRLSDDNDVYPCRYPVWDEKRQSLAHYFGLTDTTLITPFRMIYRHPAFRSAEVVNIHNMHGCYWNFWTVPALARSVPVVLTFHDEWLYTGDCVYTYDCDRWQHSCGSCPQMSWDFHPDLGDRDLTRVNLFLKRMAMRLSRADRIQIVTPSQWLAQRVRTTELGRFPVSIIPNGIDVVRFHSCDRRSAKRRLSLPEDKFCFLFFASNLPDQRKGLRHLERTLNKFGLPPNSLMLLVGNGAHDIARKYKDLPLRAMGYQADTERVVECFSAADCMLLLSEADNLPYTAIEASACGCPVLAFDVGGIQEIVEDGYNGRLIPKGAEPTALPAAMKEFANISQENWQRLSRQARERAMRCFSIDDFICRYETLFAKLTESHGNRRLAKQKSLLAEKNQFAEEIISYALKPENRATFARLLNRILPAYTQWTWGRDSVYRLHFNDWQRHGFNLSSNHYYSPIPDVGRLQESDFNRTFTMPGIDLREADQLRFLEECTRFRDEYTRFPLSGSGHDRQFHFKNGVFESCDGEILHCMVRYYQPARVIEVGSGFTTLITAAACESNRRLHGVTCEFTAIEPYPNNLFHKPIPGLSTLLSDCLQNVDLEIFSTLRENDILFIDSSHVLKIGSDVQLIYLEIIPRLRPGVIVHFHDIFLPGEYPKEWVLQEHIFWNEQYLLQAFLSFNMAFEILWAGAFMHYRHSERLRETFPAYDSSRCLPGSFWIRRRS